MPSITVKNISDELYENLRRSAEANHRSINKEIIYCIEQMLMSQRKDPDAILSRARELREKSRDYLISDEELARAKRAGRP
jgi:plasmid stability protein